MLTFVIVLGYIIFVLILVAGVVAVMLSLPGTVLILLDALVFAACTHWQRPGWWVLLIVAMLALIAETSDSLLSMLATRQGGGTTKSGWVAMGGGLGGALLGSLLSPLLGSLGLLGFILGVVVLPLALAVTGGYYAVYWYEVKQGRTPQQAQQSAKGALFGRLLGVMSKTLLAIIMSGILLWTVFVPLLRH